MFTDSTNPADYAGWAGTFLFPYLSEPSLGIDASKFYVNWLLNAQPFTGTLPDGTAMTLKHTPGTYDLVSAIEASSKEGGLFHAAYISVFGPPGATDTNQSALIAKTNTFFQTYYSLPDNSEFLPGPDLLFSGFGAAFPNNQYVVGTLQSDNDLHAPNTQKNAIITGGPGDDIIYGTDLGDDLIDGGGGNNTIYAGGGNDIVFGGSGDSIIYGHSGLLPAASRFDVLVGGPGDGAAADTAVGNGPDLADPAPPNDTIYAAAGNNVIDGAGGEDTFIVDSNRYAAEDNVLWGAGGVDTYQFIGSNSIYVVSTTDPTLSRLETLDLPGFITSVTGGAAPSGPVTVLLNPAAGSSISAQDQYASLAFVVDAGGANEPDFRPLGSVDQGLWSNASFENGDLIIDLQTPSGAVQDTLTIDPAQDTLTFQNGGTVFHFAPSSGSEAPAPIWALTAAPDPDQMILNVGNDTPGNSRQFLIAENGVAFQSGSAPWFGSLFQENGETLFGSLAGSGWQFGGTTSTVDVTPTTIDINSQELFGTETQTVGSGGAVTQTYDGNYNIIAYHGPETISINGQSNVVDGNGGFLNLQGEDNFAYISENSELYGQGDIPTSLPTAVEVQGENGMIVINTSAQAAVDYSGNSSSVLIIGDGAAVTLAGDHSTVMLAAHGDTNLLSAGTVNYFGDYGHVYGAGTVNMVGNVNTINDEYWMSTSGNFGIAGTGDIYGNGTHLIVGS